MFTKRFTLFVAILVIASMSLTACGAASAPQESQTPQEICGKAGVWYTEPTANGLKVYCNTGPGTEDPVATEAPVATEEAVAEAPAQPQNFCGQARDLGPWAPTSDGIGETFEVTATLDDSIGIVLGLWFPDGNTPWGTKEITTFVEPGLSIEVQAGAGRGFDYPVGCTPSEVDSQLADHMVQRKLDTNYNGYVDVDELIRLGLVVVRFDRRGQ